MNIHLVSDEKFINQANKWFEKFYKRKNIFFVNVSSEKGLRLVEKKENIITLNFKSDLAAIKVIECIPINISSVNIFVHFLDKDKASLVLDIKKQRNNLALYWIFYGADLYRSLYSKGKYKLYDRPGFINRIRQSVTQKLYKFHMLPTGVKNKERLISEFDFFCTWNPYDYYLLKSHYSTKAKFKYFRYFNFEIKDIRPINRSREINILVNHSASISGNHITVFDQIAKIDLKRVVKSLYVPLSYGEKRSRKKIIKYAKKKFGVLFVPISTFMVKEEYFSFLTNINIAIFGHLRPEGANNIFFLLAHGCKIFLRKDNTLLKYLKNKKLVVFEFESDLETTNDLSPLPIEIQEYNRKIIIEDFRMEKILQTYKNLIV